MQLIQRTSCPSRQRSPFDYLATMIDRKTRDHNRPHAGSDGPPGRAKTGSPALDVNELIWVEGGDEPLREPADRRHRGILVAAHGSGQGSMDGSFVISYPMAEDDRGPHIPAVTRLLETLGWSVVASRHGKAVEGSVDFSLLVSNAPAGQERRLWLTEPVGGVPLRSEPGDIPAPGVSAAHTKKGSIGIAVMRNQIEAWVNEGGAGDDVAI